MVKSAVIILAGAGAVGALIGVGFATTTPGETRSVASAVRATAVASGLERLRAPQPGDSWSGCNDARAAGTAPIYRGEPGYRADIDGDYDGIACEVHRG